MAISLWDTLGQRHRERERERKRGNSSSRTSTGTYYTYEVYLCWGSTRRLLGCIGVSKVQHHSLLLSPPPAGRINGCPPRGTVGVGHASRSCVYCVAMQSVYAAVVTLLCSGLWRVAFGKPSNRWTPPMFIFRKINIKSLGTSLVWQRFPKINWRSQEVLEPRPIRAQLRFGFFSDLDFRNIVNTGP